jgi:hypothetical protein
VEFAGVELKLIDNYYQVADNADRYYRNVKDLPALQALMGQYRDWYYVSVNGQFGPPDFLGYQDMTGDWYLYYRDDKQQRKLNLNAAKKVLNKYFEITPAGYAAAPALEKELILFLGRLNQKPNPDHRVLIPV